MFPEFSVPDRPLVIDGGLSTALELLGHDLSHPLWTARFLADNPQAIVDAHRSFVEAGARLVISSSYQASIPGFLAIGIEEATARRLIARSTTLARRAGVAVAASIGPYGAFLADGSEYRGDYPIGPAELTTWHRPRFEILDRSGPDLLAVETIPCVDEVKALRPLIAGTGSGVWVSLTCGPDGRLRSGEDVAAAVELVDDLANVVAVGVNCTHPDDVGAALRRIRESTAKPLLAYPNLGGQWDAGARTWVGGEFDWIPLVGEWIESGVRLIGGCCGSGPDQIRRLAGLVGTGEGSPPGA